MSTLDGTDLQSGPSQLWALVALLPTADILGLGVTAMCWRQRVIQSMALI